MNIAIIGAGLMGRLCAWRCAQQNYTVNLFDRDARSAEQSSAWVAAAMLAPTSESISAPPSVYAMGCESLARWPAIIKDLEEHSQQQIFFQRNGSIAVAHAQDQSDLAHFESHLLQLEKTRAQNEAQDKSQQQSTEKNTGDVIKLNHQQLTFKEPALAKNFSHGLHLPNEGCLDNRQLLSALEKVLSQHPNVTWHENTHVETIAPHQIKLRDEKNFKSFDTVIDCRGAGAIGSIDELRGVRGEIIWIKANEVELKHPVRLMHPRYQIYIAPHADNVFAIGATEIESSDQNLITVRSSLELLSALYSVSSQFAEAHIIGSYARLRPAFNDNLPRIKHQLGLIEINGLYRHGYLLAPAIIHDTLQLLNSALTQKFNPDTLLWPQIYQPQTKQHAHFL